MPKNPTFSPDPSKPFDLDALLTPEECAAWLKMEVREVLRNPKRIPQMRIGHKTVRFHPRTVLEHFKPKWMAKHP